MSPVLGVAVLLAIAAALVVTIAFVDAQLERSSSAPEDRLAKPAHRAGASRFTD